MSAFQTTNITNMETVSINFTEDELIVLSNVSIIMNTISLVCCLIIIISFAAFRGLRQFGYEFVLYMAIATSIRAVSKMFGEMEDPTACTIQGAILTYGGLSTFYWILSVGILMYSMVFCRRVWFKANLSTLRRYLLIINYLTPLLFAFLPITTNSYAGTGGWCWIEGETLEGKIFRWLCYYGQLVIVLMFSIFLYIKILINVKCGSRNEGFAPDEGMQNMYNVIKWYPSCLIFGFLVAAYRRFVQLFDPVSVGSFAWQMSQGVTSGLFGFFLLIVYGRLGEIVKECNKRYDCCNMSENMKTQRRTSCPTPTTHNGDIAAFETLKYSQAQSTTEKNLNT